MDIGYQYANKDRTSILLKFKGIFSNQTNCFLIDSGDGVDVDNLLGDNEYLSGIFLTHLHRDHYVTLGDNIQDGAEIYTSSLNYDLLKTVLSTADKHYEKSIPTKKILDSTTPVNGEQHLIGNLNLKTAPAGHTPGATSFYLQFQNNGEKQTILITGDFTRRRVAGYPGLDPKDADCIILTGATEENFRENITQATNSITEHSKSGSPTLVTSSGTNSIHIAYLLGHTVERQSGSTRISIVGQAAKIYDKLDYNVPNVDSFPVYNSEQVINKNEITISGPETPTDGGSKQLFNEIKDNSNASLFQLISSDHKTISKNRCTVNKFEIRNHPSQKTVDQLIRTVDPIQIIITHQSGADLRKYRDKYRSIVWANAEDRIHNFYVNNEWVAPDWMDRDVANRFLNKKRHQDAKLEIPDIETCKVDFTFQKVNLGAEGLNINEIIKETNNERGKYPPRQVDNDKPKKKQTQDSPNNTISISGKVVHTDENTVIIETDENTEIKNGAEVQLNNN